MFSFKDLMRSSQKDDKDIDWSMLEFEIDMLKKTSKEAGSGVSTNSKDTSGRQDLFRKYYNKYYGKN